MKIAANYFVFSQRCRSCVEPATALWAWQTARVLQPTSFSELHYLYGGRCRVSHLNLTTSAAFIGQAINRSYWFRVKAGSNTSTVVLRVVGGDEKGNLKFETVKYGHESHGTWIREWLRWRVPAAIVNDRPVLSWERAPHINKPATVWQ
jgi:hypothetical protein